MENLRKPRQWMWVFEVNSLWLWKTHTLKPDPNTTPLLPTTIWAMPRVNEHATSLPFSEEVSWGLGADGSYATSWAELAASRAWPPPPHPTGEVAPPFNPRASLISTTSLDEHQASSRQKACCVWHDEFLVLIISRTVTGKQAQVGFSSSSNRPHWAAPLSLMYTNTALHCTITLYTQEL